MLGTGLDFTPSKFVRVRLQEFFRNHRERSSRKPHKSSSQADNLPNGWGGLVYCLL